MSKKYVKMWGEENENVYDLESILLNYGPKARDRYGYGIQEGLVFFKNYYTELYLKDNEVRRSSDDGYKFYTNEKKLEYFIKQADQDCAKIIQNIKSLAASDFSDLSNNKFAELYNKFGSDIGNVYVTYSITQPRKIMKLENELTDYIKLKVKNDPDSLFTKITAPDKKHVFSEEHVFFNKSFKELFEENNDDLDINLIEKDLFIEEIADTSEFESEIKKLQPPDEILKIIRALKIITEKRMKLRLHWMLLSYYHEIFLVEIKKRWKVNKKELRLYYYYEIDELINKNNKVSEHILKDRLRGVVKELDNGKINTFEGEEAEEYFNKATEVKKDKNIIKGMVVSPGKAKGRVKIFSYKQAEDHSEKIKNMKKGDILVTEMTRPNIIPAMKKAGAVITDEGGITSHAAIVCREFGIPGIVGTKNATDVLKDGDEVEIDAEKGIVRKI